MSFENDADLFSYQRRIDELEALASSRQKEVCVAPELKMSIEVKASRILINIWQWSSAHWDQGFKAFTKIYIDRVGTQMCGIPNSGQTLNSGVLFVIGVHAEFKAGRG